MEEKKRSNTWLIVLLVLIILGLVGYICYDKLLSNKVEQNTSDLLNNRNLSEKKDAMGIAKSVLKQYTDSNDSCNYLFYDAILNKSVSELSTKYSDDKVYDHGLYLAWSKSDVVLEKTEKLSFEICSEKGLTECNKYTYNVKSLTSVYQSLFGPDHKPIIGHSFNTLKSKDETTFMSCTLEKNNTMVCQEFAGGDLCIPRKDEILEAYIQNNVLTIVDKITGVDSTGNDETKTYKLNFEQDNNNNYYWVSTELVK